MYHSVPFHRSLSCRVGRYISALVLLCGLVPAPFLWGQPSFNSTHRARLLKLAQAAQTAVKNNQFVEAFDFYQSAWNLADSTKDYLAGAAFLNFIGATLEQMREYQRALSSFENGVNVLNRKGASSDALLIKEALRNLQVGAKTYVGGSGQPISADLYRGEIENFASWLAQPPAQAEPQLVVMLMMNVANMYLLENQYDLADARYKAALLLARRYKIPRREQQILTNLAWSAVKNKRYEEADARLDSVMRAYATGAPAVELRRAFLAVGVNLREQKKIPAALTNLERALELYKTAGDNLGRGRALTHLAATYLQMGDFAKAQTYFQEALQVNAVAPDNAINWQAHVGLAQCYQQAGDFASALVHYETYVALVQEIGENYRTDEGKISIFENHAANFAAYVETALANANGRYERVRQAIERLRARTLENLQLTRLQALPRRAGEIPAHLVLFGSFAPINFATPNSPGINPFDARQMAPGAISSADSKMAPGIPSMPLPSRPGDLAGTLPDSAVRVPGLSQPTFLEYYILPQKTAILVKTPTGEVHGSVVEIDENKLTQLVTEYGQALDVETPRGFELPRQIIPSAATPKTAPRAEAVVSQQLYQMLIAPIKQYLPADTKQTVVIAPHQALWALPFAALRDERNNYFNDQHVLTYAASASSWELLARQSRPADHKNLRAWVVGNPRMPTSAEACGFRFALQALPGAQQEAKAIAQLLGPKRAELFTGVAADALRLEAWHQDFTVLHFATHGFACVADPLSSFIVLSEIKSAAMQLDTAQAKITLRHDRRWPVTLQAFKNLAGYNPMPPAYPGILTARTILDSERFQLRADLVTLSACQTGLGQLLNEGMIGFSRAFLAAGARSLAVSLWRVDDQATKNLMVAFYKEYLQHGNKGLALQQAMQQTRRKYPAPKYWAAFTLFGMAE